MQVYACREVPKEDQEIFFQMKEIFENMPEIDLGKNNKGQEVDVSCHMLARAFAQFFPVTVKDGFFFKKGNFHSWLETKQSIMDVYPIAMMGGPVLVDKKGYNPWSQQYLEDILPGWVFGDDEITFQNNVQKVIDVVGKTMEALSMRNGKENVVADRKNDLIMGDLYVESEAFVKFFNPTKEVIKKRIKMITKEIRQIIDELYPNQL